MGGAAQDPGHSQQSPGRGHQSGWGPSPESSRVKGLLLWDTLCCSETQPTRGGQARQAALSRVVGSSSEGPSDPRAKGAGQVLYKRGGRLQGGH